MTAVRSAAIAALMLLTAAVPSGATQANAGETELHMIQFQRTTRTSFLFVVMLRLEVRGAYYAAPAGAYVNAHEPFTFVYGCVAAGFKGVLDVACGRQKASAFKFSQDMSKVSLAFKGRSQAYRIPITARLTTSILGNSPPAPIYDVGLPVPPASTLLVETGAERTGWGKTSGKVTMSRFGSTRVSSTSTTINSTYAAAAELRQ